MTILSRDSHPSRKPLRLWPGVAAASAIAVLRFVVPLVVPDAAVYGLLGALAGGAVIVVWWLLFSRAPWVERVGALALMVAAALATKLVVHPSVAGGMMGMMVFVYAIPSTLSLAFVAWAVVTRHQSDRLRRASLVAAVVLGCGVWTLVRTGGVSGEGISDLHWRWTPTPEERLLAQERDPVHDRAAGPSGAAAPLTAPVAPETPAVAPPENAASSKDTEAVKGAADDRARTTVAEWPGFRGPHRDSVVAGVRIKTDWSVSPPAEMWRRPVGPGWSSFAVDGGLVYTQEQRGEDEVVSCYRLRTGEPVWRHRDRVRFWESNGGAGPRATPTLSRGRVYTMGATGIVNALDAATGAVVWSRNAAADTHRDVPEWGLASSPLAIDDLLVVAAAGHLVAYDVETGKPRWFGPTGGGGYSSPHLATIGGVTQILLMRGSRTISLASGDGTLLWDHEWQPAVAIVQPALTPDGDVLIAAGDMMGGLGLRRLTVKHAPSGWTVEERWTSRGLKPYFNDFVVHKGHAFGFDGTILSCIDLADGTRKWKGGRYGHGQLLLVADQDVLVVLSEEGEVALVGATPDKFTEIARFKAIEGKTWNHPALAGEVLLLRNDQEMAAFRLARSDR